MLNFRIHKILIIDKNGNVTHVYINTLNLTFAAYYNMLMKSVKVNLSSEKFLSLFLRLLVSKFRKLSNAELFSPRLISYVIYSCIPVGALIIGFFEITYF